MRESELNLFAFMYGAKHRMSEPIMLLAPTKDALDVEHNLVMEWNSTL